MDFGLSRLLGLRKSATLRDDPIFIFASGNRCGSTLLQRLLNSHRDILIWGEHGGYLKPFFGAGEDLVDWCFDKAEERQRYIREGYDHFMPNLSPTPEQVRRVLAQHVEMLFGRPAQQLGRAIWGFKEVRYTASVALSLQECFPSARFIHLTRKIEDCLQSLKRWEATGGWDPQWTRNSIDNWMAVNKEFLAEGDKLNQLLRVKYEDMVGSPPAKFATTLAGFLRTRPEDFDLNVFSHRLGATGGLASSNQLTENDLAAISAPRFSALAVH